MSPFRPDRGFSLVEVTLAVGVIAFCLIVLVGLLPGGLMAVRDGANEEAAADLLAVVSMDVSQTTGETSPVFGVPVRSESPEVVTRFCDGGGKVLPTTEDARFRVDITPRDSGNPRLRFWHAAVVCPPQAASPARPSAETLVPVSLH